MCRVSYKLGRDADIPLTVNTYWRLRNISAEQAVEIFEAPNLSKYKGVQYAMFCEKWQPVYNRVEFDDFHDTEKAAALAYDKVVRDNHGRCALLSGQIIDAKPNFPLVFHSSISLERGTFSSTNTIS